MIKADRRLVLSRMEKTCAKMGADRNASVFFQKGEGVEVGYVLKDLELTFYLRLVDGRMEVVEGAAPNPAVVMEMDFSTHHSILMRTMHPMEAVARRKIRIKVENQKKMSLILPMTGVMCRAYRESVQEETGCEEVRA
ncbi:SCP2 sterol-binding domain-containing protein [Desulfotomaculum copahuensis]|uniref:SCP2 domain-containing protein n=1 Tax=Desulfotomaculum copahuensis TaxID=1838280 RepID=A0A1B7LG19_9FIRM|nr:SCP2 sterol-binding domain-containing protein [Desulfotomaculum copahuensis]OAT83614.1 hypothetical protein A6M21_07990 [Desulfotomaculum copahuensis]